MTRFSNRQILFAVFCASLLPFLAVEIFHSSLYVVINTAHYLVFHNIAEFFSVIVSFSIFGVGWFTYEQSRNRHVLFLSTAFLAIGLIDFMHALGYGGMPDFITHNSTTKASQYWVAARLLDASAFLLSAFIYPESRGRFLSKPVLLAGSLSVSGVVFAAVTFFPDYVPATFLPGVGLTPFKIWCEYVVIALLVAAFVAYWERMARTGDRMLVYCLSAFIICIFSELVFTFYKSVSDTYNFLGHVYKILAFSLVYRGTFAVSVNKPWVKLSREIEEHKRARAEIDLLNAELEQRVADRTVQLEAANKELEAFSYSVSHDLRAPLRAIVGYAKMLTEDFQSRLDSEGNRLLGVITDSAREMGQLIDDILEFSRYSRREMRHTAVQMHDLVQDVFSDVTRTEPERAVDFSLAPLPPAHGDPALIRQVLHNLLSNALKYSRPREFSVVEVGATAGEEEHTYFVRDNGVGFDMKYSDKLFGVFQRLHTADEFEGTGVGLAIVQRIVARHGGRVWGESSKGEGATFYFTLPATVPQGGALPGPGVGSASCGA